MDDGVPFLLIDVTDPESYEKEHIFGAANIPLNKITHKAREWIEKHTELIVYSDDGCEDGSKAAQKLSDLGFKYVYHYCGGLNDWKKAGLPVSFGK